MSGYIQMKDCDERNSEGITSNPSFSAVNNKNSSLDRKSLGNFSIKSRYSNLSDRSSLWRKGSFSVPEIENPFERSQIHLNCCDWIKVIVMSLTIAPIKAVLVIMSFIVASIFGFFSVNFRPENESHLPLRGIRWGFTILCAFFVRLGLFFGGFFWIRVSGKRCNTSDARLLVVAPHTSFLDAIVIYTHLLRVPSVLSREQNEHIPIIKYLLQSLQPLCVNRTSNAATSKQNVSMALRDRVNSILPWPQLVIFPEGTCGNGKCLINFKAGAFSVNAPVQPVAISYGNRIDTITWTEKGPKLSLLIWLTLCQFYTNVHISYLDVYEPSMEELSDPKLYASHVRAVIANHLKIPTTDHTFDDIRLMKKARQYNLPVSSGVIEFSKISRKLNLDYSRIEELFARFVSISLRGPCESHKKGQISLDEFAHCLNLPSENHNVRKIFAIFDRSKSGYIDFREYVIGLSLLSKEKTLDDTVRLTFQLFARSSEVNRVAVSDMEKLLETLFGLQSDECAELIAEMTVDGGVADSISLDEFMAYMKAKPELLQVIHFFQSHKRSSHSVQEVSFKTSANIV